MPTSRQVRRLRLESPPSRVQTMHRLGRLSALSPVTATMEAPSTPYAFIRSEIRITIDGPFDRREVVERFHVEPRVNGTLRWADERTLLFQPEELAYDTTYRLRISNVRGLTWEWSFTTIKPITLTFDDCGSEAQIRAVLAALAERRWRAIMFPTGLCRNWYPWLVPALQAGAHRVCNHTYSHPRLTRLTDTQISEEIRRGVSVNCNLFRPPWGDWDGPNGRVARAAARLGYRVFMWDVDTFDWNWVSADEILERIRSRGGVILLHFHGRGTVEALRRLDLTPVPPT